MTAARKRWLSVVLFAIALAGASQSFAVQPDEILPDPALESRARTLSSELRCMVCQNQSIDDSDAPLARDLRLLVRERLKAGDSDTQVLDFLTARYGQFVLLKPRFGWDTALLWLAPAGVLLAGAWGLVALLRRRRASPGECRRRSNRELTAAERGRLGASFSTMAGTQQGHRPNYLNSLHKYSIFEDYQRLILPPRRRKAGHPIFLSNAQALGR